MTEYHINRHIRVLFQIYAKGQINYNMCDIIVQQEAYKVNSMAYEALRPCQYCPLLRTVLLQSMPPTAPGTLLPHTLP